MLSRGRLAPTCLLLTLMGFLLLTGVRAVSQEKKPAVKEPAADKTSYARDVLPIVQKYCTKCHGGKEPKASLALDAYKDEASVLKRRDVWDKVLHNVRKREMPPS